MAVINTKKTILLLGISSFVGSNLAEFLKKDYRIIGTYFENPVTIPGVLSIKCNILEKDALQYLIYNFVPEIIIYCVGISSLVDSIKDEKYTEVINTGAIFNVTNISERIKAKFCLISSSYVFSGVGKEFTENDTPDPRTVYGKSKTGAEFFVQKSCLNYVIFRCCQLYGRSYNHKTFNWFETVQSCMSARKIVNCDSNILHGFVDVLYLAMIIKMCLEKDVINRLFHISSEDTMSYYEFALKYCEVFGEDSSFLQKGNWNFPIIKNELSYEYLNEKKNFQLKVVNIENFLNIKLPSIQESLQFTFKRMGGDKKLTKRRTRSGGHANYI